MSAANYVNPEAHTIEALLLYARAEWTTSQDAVIETSAVITLTIRLAMRMGIHRDSKAHPGIIPFSGAMRRRIWAVIGIMDTLYSLQTSLPASIHPGECDCELPRNIFDHEFDESTLKLPPSRVLTTDTGTSYMLLKAQMLHVFQRILRLEESSNSVSSIDVTNHEQSLDEVRRMIPHLFQMNPSQPMGKDSHP